MGRSNRFGSMSSKAILAATALSLSAVVAAAAPLPSDVVAPPEAKSAPYVLPIELPKGSGTYWWVIAVGNCAVIMDRSALGLNANDTSFSGETWTGMSWSGACDARGLAAGRGVLTVTYTSFSRNDPKYDKRATLERKITMHNGSPKGPGTWTRTEYYGWEGFKTAHFKGENIEEEWIGWEPAAADPIYAVIAMTRGRDGKVRGVPWSDLPAAGR